MSLDRIIKPRYIALVRLLLYSNEIDIEGVVATTSTWLPNEVHPQTLHDIVEGYRQVHHNLIKHSPDYPKADHIDSVIVPGNSTYGMAEIGEGHDSEGSDLIIKIVDKDDDRLVHMGLWGGANTLAQALFKVKATRPQEDVDKFINKLQVYGISDQDDAGPWIRRNFPMLRYIVSVHGENQYNLATWTGISGDLSDSFDGPDKTLVSKEWLAENIQIGPLGAKYPSYKYIMEGDTPAFLGVIPNGLNVPERPDWGGWGGRYKKIRDPGSRHYHDSTDEFVSPVDGKVRSTIHTSIWRWRDAFQHDFAARMQWTLDSPRTRPNHPPTVVVNGSDAQQPLFVRVKHGETIELDASASTDVDGDSLTFEWLQYKECDTFIGASAEVATLDLHGTEKTDKLKVTFPQDTTTRIGFLTLNKDSQNFHLILKVTDDGIPALTRYKRVVVTVGK